MIQLFDALGAQHEHRVRAVAVDPGPVVGADEEVVRAPGRTGQLGADRDLLDLVELAGGVEVAADQADQHEDEHGAEHSQHDAPPPSRPGGGRPRCGDARRGLVVAPVPELLPADAEEGADHEPEEEVHRGPLRKVKVTGPTPISSPSVRRIGLVGVTRVPLRRVPLLEPSSVRVQRSPSRRMTAWRRLTRVSSTGMSRSGPRPIVVTDAQHVIRPVAPHESGGHLGGRSRSGAARAAGAAGGPAAAEPTGAARRASTAGTPGRRAGSASISMRTLRRHVPPVVLPGLGERLLQTLAEEPGCLVDGRLVVGVEPHPELRWDGRPAPLGPDVAQHLREHAALEVGQVELTAGADGAAHRAAHGRRARGGGGAAEDPRPEEAGQQPHDDSDQREHEARGYGRAAPPEVHAAAGEPSPRPRREIGTLRRVEGHADGRRGRSGRPLRGRRRAGRRRHRARAADRPCRRRSPGGLPRQAVVREHLLPLLQPPAHPDRAGPRAPHQRRLRRSHGLRGAHRAARSSGWPATTASPAGATPRSPSSPTTPTRGRGLATVLLEYLAAAARDVGVTGFHRAGAPAEPPDAVGVQAGRVRGHEPLRRRRDRGRARHRADRGRARRDGRAGQPAPRPARWPASSTRARSPSSARRGGAGTLGHAVFRRLVEAGFDGPVYPVNPEAGHVGSVRAYPSVLDVPDEVDLAVVVVPASEVPEVVEDCGQKRVRGLVVISAGFAEAGRGRRRGGGPAGRPGPQPRHAHGRPEHHGRDQHRAPGAAARVVHRGRCRPPAASGCSSQSGTIGAAVLDELGRHGLGVSTFVAAGNKADVSGNDLLQYWEQDDRTDVVLLYLESFGNPRNFAADRPPGLDPQADRGGEGGSARAAGDEVLDDETPRRRRWRSTRSSPRPASSGSRPSSSSSTRPGSSPTSPSRAAAGWPCCPTSGGRRSSRRTPASRRGWSWRRCRTAPSRPSRRRSASDARLSNPLELTSEAGPAEYGAAMAALVDDPQVDAVLVLHAPTIPDRTSEVARAVAGAVSTHGADDRGGQLPRPPRARCARRPRPHPRPSRSPRPPRWRSAGWPGTPSGAGSQPGLVPELDGAADAVGGAGAGRGRAGRARTGRSSWTPWRRGRCSPPTGSTRSSSGWSTARTRRSRPPRRSATRSP